MSTTTIVKIGGRAAAQERPIVELAKEIRELSLCGTAAAAHGGSDAADRRGSRATPHSSESTPLSRIVLVHGGGNELTDLMEHYGFTPQFRDGIRRTSEKEMPLVDMALGGRMNSGLVRHLGRAGLRPVGLNAQDGGTVVGRAVVMPDGTESRTGRVEKSDPALINLLLDGGYTPVVSPVSRDQMWEGLNINADEVALALARAVEARQLIFISDTPGIFDGERLLSQLTASEAEGAIQSGTIAGGMIPKVRSSLDALRHGVGSITIGEYREAGDLDALSRGRKGTVLVL